jgi:hypothetical protein
MRTLQEMAVAIDRTLPPCAAVSEAPTDSEARQALMRALAPLADESFLRPVEHASPHIRALCNFVHVQAILVLNCLALPMAPDHSMKLIIVGRTRELLAILDELKKALAGAAG